MLSLIKNQFTARAIVAPARLAPVAPLAAQWFSTSTASFAPKAKKTAAKKPAAKKPAPKKAAPKKPVVKGPTNAYAFFVKSYYAENGDQLKGIPFSERAKTLREKWDYLSSFEKSKYIGLQEQDAQRYASEKAAAAEKAAPKRPLTGYIAWFNNERESLVNQNPGMTFAELGKLGGEIWKSLPESSKAPYVEKGKKELEAWKVEMAKWKEAQA